MNVSATTSHPATAIDPRLFRDVLGHYPTGVALVTAVLPDGAPIGMVVGTFSSVSIDPPLVSFMPTRTSRTFEALRTASSFCINVLAADQQSVCRTFARPGDNKFSTVDWAPSASGAPIIDGVVAALDCTFESIVEAGDHFIVLGGVADLRVVNPVAPLLFFQGGYGRFSEASFGAYADADVVAGARLAERARGILERLADDLDAECAAFAPAAHDLSVVAVALGRSRTPRTTLGSRVPLIPPLGEQYVAHGEPEAAERWLQRGAGARDPELLDRYRERLHDARERGWSASIAGGISDAELLEAISEYSAGELTPARLAHLRAVISDADARYEAVNLAADERTSISTISVPVLAADGRVQLVLRLAQLPADAGAEQVEDWVRLLRAAANEVSELAAQA